MEDKQIIELYWNRADAAIKETAEKYGFVCAYIANHILQNKEETERCVEESYTRLWETIPPRKPQNLKAYVCKITRYHALDRKPQNENMKQVLDEIKECIPQLSANANQLDEQVLIEIAFAEFLKKLQPDERKIFIARYWYFASVSEISTLYKKREKKIVDTLLQLRQKLKAVLEQEGICLQGKDETLLYALTEIEDRYLEEAEPQKEEHEETYEKIKDKFRWNKSRGVVAIVVCALILILIIGVFPKNFVEQPPVETEADSETQEALDPNEYVQIWAGETMTVEDFDKQTENLPWNVGVPIAALPIYKNLAPRSMAGEIVYLDEDTLTAMAEDIADKLDMKIMESEFSEVTDENGTKVYEIKVKTDSAYISIDGGGEVYVSFTDGVSLPPGYELSESSSKTSANRTTGFLISNYGDIFTKDKLVADCYPTYDDGENRWMNYRAVGKEDSVDIEGYYFKQLEFLYNEQLLMGFVYNDYHIGTELVGYYPIISLEEAKLLLEEGQYISNVLLEQKIVYDEAIVRRVELMYKPDRRDAYFQPYYCFYIYLEKLQQYDRFYVPAARGVKVNEDIPEPEVKILNMEEYERNGNFVYYKGGRFYTIENGEVKEGDRKVLLAKADTGEVVVEHTEYGTVTNFYYDESEVLNLDEVMKGKRYTNLGALYLDGKILIISTGIEGINFTEQITTCYLYSKEDGSLTEIIEPTPSRISKRGKMGLTFYGGRYATMGNTDGELLIVDAIEGNNINTGIHYKDIDVVRNASDQHFAVQYMSGEIVVIEKASGEIIKKTKDKMHITINGIVYKEDKLYIETWNGKPLVFIISKFEE